MTARSRREQLADRFAESSFVRKLLGPKVVEPLHGWYETAVQPDNGATSATGAPTPTNGDTNEPAEAVEPNGAPAPAPGHTTEPNGSPEPQTTNGAPTSTTGQATDSTDTPTPTTDTSDAPTPTTGQATDTSDAPTPTTSQATDSTDAPTPTTSQATDSTDTPTPTTSQATDTDSTDTDSTDTSAGSGEAHAASPSLAAAQSAEAFFAGPDAGSDPLTEPSRPRTESPATPDVEDVPATGRVAAFKDIAARVKTRVKEHNLNVVAAGVAFWGLLAIPAVLTAVISIYGLVSTPEDVQKQVDESLAGASEEVRELLSDQMTAIAGASNGGLAVGAIVGVVLALWTSSGAIAKVIATLNVIFGVSEDRKFVHLRGVALTVTLGAIVAVGVAAFLLGALPAVLAEAGFSDLGRWLVNVGRFPAMLVLMAIGLSVLYWIAPNRSRKFRIVSWGAVWGTVLWLIVSGVFSIYTASFASYNETYGAIGSIVVVLLWLFITAFMVLLGAEIEAARDERAEELKQHAQRS